MISVSGYTLTQCLYQSSNSTIYQGYRHQDKTSIILKILATGYPTPEQIAQFYNEYTLTHALTIQGVRNALTQQTIEGKPALILPYIVGETLKTYLADSDVSLATFLNVACQIADILASIHHHRLIHKDINPNNIIINPQDETVTLIDFGISSKLNLKMPHLGNPEHLEGTLHYLSPEQSGRMNRTVDFRTDFYAFGVTLYEFLVGHVPFDHDDPLSLVHAHIAKQPRPPIELIGAESPFFKTSQAVLQALSEIIMKLLAKKAANRYQSAVGVRRDLEQVVAMLDDTQAVFQLGYHDISEQFLLPEILYGREDQIDLLIRTFDELNAEAGGNPPRAALVMVSGYSGIGKSTLVYEIHKPITEKQGYFIQGKFDQYQQNIPYSALTDALNQFCRYLLTETAETLNDWREKILQAVGDNGQVLIDIIPDLALIIGPQPPVPELGPRESLNRFTLYFLTFIRTISQAEHPLVMFIDDLQWADIASLNALKMIFQDPTIQHLLVIGAYRDNEVSPGHPLCLALDEIAAHISLKTITLENLAESHVEQWVADTLHQALKSARPLAALVYEKTLGNPFFVRQFLQSLHDEGLIWFEQDERNPQWRWEINQIHQKAMTDNVVTLMVRKISRQSAKMQAILQIAACIGNQFDLRTIAWVTSTTVQETIQLILQGIEAGFFVPLDEQFKYLAATDKVTNGSFRFIHDRIQQAAYSMLTSAEQTRMHLKIGRLLLAHTPPTEYEEEIFAIANQLNQGRALITDSAEKLTLIALNLMAGSKAKLATAYQGAFDYLQIGLNMLPDTAWQDHYELTYNLHKEIISCAYLIGAFDFVDRWVQSALAQARTKLDYLTVQITQVSALIARKQFEEAVDICLKVLEELGVALPKKVTRRHVLLVILQTKYHLRGKSMTDLFTLPPLQDETIKTAFTLLIQAGSSFFITNPLLFILGTLKALILSLQHGNSAPAGLFYAGYGMVLAGALQNHEQGVEFGELGVRIAEKYHDPLAYVRSYYLLYGLLGHWKFPLSEGLPKMLENYQHCLAVGDTEFASLALNHYVFQSVCAGSNLIELADQAKSFTQQIETLKQENALTYMKIYYQLILNLMGESERPHWLKGPIFDGNRWRGHFLQGQDRSGLFRQHAIQAMLCYQFGEYELAWQESTQAQPYIDAVLGMMNASMFHFFDILIRLAILPNASKRDRFFHQRVIRKNKKKLQAWASSCPENYAQKYDLTQAEIYRYYGDFGQAHACYQRAIILAKKHAFQGDLALGYELAGRFYLEQSQTELAHFFLRQAYQAYHTWGATAKVQYLAERYPDFNWHSLFANDAAQVTAPGLRSTWTSQSTSSQALDWQSVVKAAQTLSGEINLTQLLKQLMNTVIENAGAEHGYLLLPQKGAWAIAAEGHTDKYVKTELTDVENFSDIVAESMINYVIRTQEPIVLDDAVNEGQFTLDDYIRHNQVKSVLCLPLINQGQLNGVLYLENNLTTGAFTQDRLTVLSLLASQAAISIANALLYEESVKLSAVQRELAIAHEIQQKLLPPTEPNWPDLDVVCYSAPAREVGGDLYVYHDFSPDKNSAKGQGIADSRYGIAVGDVSGKGTPAALLMAVTISTFRSTINQSLAPHLLLAQMDQSLLSSTDQGNQNCAMCYVEIDLDSHHLRDKNAVALLKAVNSGCPMPIIRRRMGQVEEVEVGGIPLGVGLGSQFGYIEVEVELHDGDLIILVSDGVPEAMNEDHDLFGFDRLTETIEAYNPVPKAKSGASEVQQMLHHINQEVKAFVKGAEAHDDLTIVVIQC